MERNDRRVRIILECPDYLHLIPSKWITFNDTEQYYERITDSDRTRAAVVVVVLDRCTSFTASLVLPASFDTLGWHNQTLPQFPKPI
jgi:hypothetical protein